MMEDEPRPLATGVSLATVAPPCTLRKDGVFCFSAPVLSITYASESTSSRGHPDRQPGGTMTKRASPYLEALEDRYLLSVVQETAAIRPHLPPGATASGAVAASTAEDRSAPPAYLRQGAVLAAEGGAAAETPSAAATATATADRSSQADRSPEGADLAVAAPPAAAVQGGSSTANLATAPARAAAGADLSQADESSQPGPGPASAAANPLGLGSTTGTAAALPVVADRPPAERETGVTPAPDAAPAPVIGLAAGRDARTAVAPLSSAPRVTASGESDALPAPPAEGVHVPSSSPLRIGRSADRPAGGVAAEAVAPEQEPLPALCGAELLASFSPFDRAAVERALDQLVERLDDLETGLFRLGTTANLIPSLTATALTIAAAEIVHRWLDSRREERGRHSGGDQGLDDDEDAGAGFPGLPGLPRHWSLEEP
jgi:hypothetical protein